MTPQEKKQLTAEIYECLVCQVDPATIRAEKCQNLTKKEADDLFAAAYQVLDDLTAPTYRAKYSQYLAGLHFVASSSFRTADFKTAMAAIEKSIKLTQYMEANDPDDDE